MALCTSNKRQTGFELETGEETGIQIENEKSVRELSREIVSDFVKVENRLFVKEDTVECEVLYGRIEALPKFVDSLLDSYNTQNLLTWQGGSIPQNEIWVKIGGRPWGKFIKIYITDCQLRKPKCVSEHCIYSHCISMRRT